MQTLAFAFFLGTPRRNPDTEEYHHPWDQLVATELWNFQGWSILVRSDSHSQDCAELDAGFPLAPLAERARLGGEPRSAMRLLPNLCFFEALPRASVALICDSSETACLSLAFPLIASATSFSKSLTQM